MATESTLRYIKLDYASHKDALLQRVRERYPGKWNDFLANSFGIVLIDIVAWGLATLAFLIHFVAGENFLPTMRLRESAVRMGQLVSYSLRSAVPASVSCEVRLSSVSTSNVVLLKGTQVRSTGTPVLPFELAKDYTIEAGYLTPRTTIIAFSPSDSGASVLDTYLSVTNGSLDVDTVDSTVDLSLFIQAGQTLAIGTATYVIQSLEKAPGAVSDYSRMVIDRAYEGDTAVTNGTVLDTRVLLVQGQTVVERYVAPVSTANYVLKLGRVPLIDNSVIVTVNGETWQPVGNVGVSGAFDKVYQVQTLTTGATVILFGDDSFGAAVPSEAPVTITYRIGGGSAGNIDLNTINTTFSGVIENLATPVTVTVTNASSTGIGGQDAETLSQARVNIPYHARTNDRAVTIEDYQTLAQQFADPQFGSVAYARAAVRRDNALLEGNIVAIYAWTTGVSGGLASLSPQLKQVLQDYLQTKAIGTDFVQIYDGTYRPVPVSLRFKVLDGFSVTDTKRLVTDTLKAAINALRPGDPIYYSNLVRSLDEVLGVDTVNMATPISDLYTSSDLELFSVPQDTFKYSLQKTGQGVPENDGTSLVSLYIAQLPVYPLAAWSFQLMLGVNTITNVPYVTAGYAQLFGQNLSTAAGYESTVNLLTGQVRLWIQGAPGDLTMQLTTVQGYSVERAVNVYVGYIGENTQTKRNEIRAALQAWSSGLSIGGAMYARQIAGITASKVSATDVVAAITGVTSVTRVALGTPGNNEDRVTAADFEVLRVGNCVINNSSAA